MVMTEEERAALVADWLSEAEKLEREIEEIIEDDWDYVLGMDPGGTTGVALLRYKPDVLPELIYLHQIPDGMEGFYDYFVGSKIGGKLVVASEVWVEHQKKGVDRTPMYIQGVQYGFWHGEGIVYQEPAQKSLIPDEYLKEQNLWTPGKRHQMDALIHALVYLRNNDHQPTMKSLSGDTEDKIAEEGEAESKTLSEPQEAAEGAEEDADGEGSPGGEDGEQGEGQGEGEPSASGNKQKTFMEVLDEMVNAEPKGPAQGQAREGQEILVEVDHSYIDPDKVEVKGKRKRRERNGVFAGFEAETDGIEKELFSD